MKSVFEFLFKEENKKNFFVINDQGSSFEFQINNDFFKDELDLNSLDNEYIFDQIIAKSLLTNTDIFINKDTCRRVDNLSILLRILDEGNIDKKRELFHELIYIKSIIYNTNEFNFDDYIRKSFLRITEGRIEILKKAKNFNPTPDECKKLGFAHPESEEYKNSLDEIKKAHDFALFKVREIILLNCIVEKINKAFVKNSLERIFEKIYNELNKRIDEINTLEFKEDELNQENYIDLSKDFINKYHEIDSISLKFYKISDLCYKDNTDKKNQCSQIQEKIKKLTEKRGKIESNIDNKRQEIKQKIQAHQKKFLNQALKFTLYTLVSILIPSVVFSAIYFSLKLIQEKILPLINDKLYDFCKNNIYVNYLKEFCLGVMISFCLLVVACILYNYVCEENKIEFFVDCKILPDNQLLKECKDQKVVGEFFKGFGLILSEVQSFYIRQK